MRPFMSMINVMVWWKLGSPNHLKISLNVYDLIEYTLTGNRYTWFQPRFMIIIDKAFTSLKCFLEFLAYKPI